MPQNKSWNWQHPNWPNFTWKAERLTRAEALFAEAAGIVIGTTQHLDEAAQEALMIDIMRDEACDTSEIEGEILDRDSVQSSIRRQLGLKTDRRAGPMEAGIAEMMVDLYRNLTTPFSEKNLYSWHAMVMNGRRDLADIGRYRQHEELMQIVSGPNYRRRVHYEAPPSAQVPAEMARLLTWLRKTASGGPGSIEVPLPPLTRAGIAHLWFESIHPFEDGNGRIGRAIVEKALAQGLSRPALTGVSGTFLKRRKDYYQALENASGTLDATDWLLWFAAAAIEAARRTEAHIAFILDKARLLASLGGKLNARQEKALLRLFEAGQEGFIGGLSARNYRTITGATPATTTRDLVDLVTLGALTRTGERKGARYHLAVPLHPVEHLGIEEIAP